MSATTQQTIEKELNDLWMPHGQGPASASSGSQRSYTLNLVVHAPCRETCREAEAVLKGLTPLHPGRFITLCSAPELESVPLRHQVASHCVYNPERRKQICCDLINLEAKPDILDELYGLTLSLLISDLPVEFWWLGDLNMHNPFFHKIADDSDRVWVDSSNFAQPHKDLATLAATWQHEFPNTVLADLNWIRFARWRDLTAELFDGEWTPYLKEIDHLTIEYGGGRQPTRSFLLACWMASRLGWRYQGEPLTEFPSEIEFTSNHGPVTVTIKSAPAADQERDRLYSIRVHTKGKRQGVFTVVRDQDPQCVVASSELDGRQAFSRILCFEHLEALELLSDGLTRWGRDPAWEGTLAIVRTIMHGS